MMQVKCLEVRDRDTFIPVLCIRPMPDNDAQRYLLQRDGYSCTPDDPTIIMIDAQCRGVAYGPYNWPGATRTKPAAHKYIVEHWAQLEDGDVVDVEWILGEAATPKESERLTAPV